MIGILTTEVNNMAKGLNEDGIRYAETCLVSNEKVLCCFLN